MYTYNVSQLWNDNNPRKMSHATTYRRQSPVWFLAPDRALLQLGHLYRIQTQPAHRLPLWSTCIGNAHYLKPPMVDDPFPFSASWDLGRGNELPSTVELHEDVLFHTRTHIKLYTCIGTHLHTYTSNFPHTHTSNFTFQHLQSQDMNFHCRRCAQSSRLAPMCGTTPTRTNFRVALYTTINFVNMCCTYTQTPLTSKGMTVLYYDALYSNRSLWSWIVYVWCINHNWNVIPMVSNQPSGWRCVAALLRHRWARPSSMTLPHLHCQQLASGRAEPSWGSRHSPPLDTIHLCALHLHWQYLASGRAEPSCWRWQQQQQLPLSPWESPWHMAQGDCMDCEVAMVSMAPAGQQAPARLAPALAPRRQAHSRRHPTPNRQACWVPPSSA